MECMSSVMSDPISTLARKKPHVFPFSEFHCKKLRFKAPIVSPLSASLSKDTWTGDQEARSRRQWQPHHHYPRRVSVDVEALLSSMSATTNEGELYSLLSPYEQGQLPFRFMVSLLSREPNWQRSLALLDWIHEVASYKPTVLAYNLVLRSVLRARQWVVARGLFDEMRQKGLAPDRFTYSMLITRFGRAGMFDSALALLQLMEEDRVVGDLVLYSNLICLCYGMCDYEKAISIFSRVKESGIRPDRLLYNVMINVFGKAKLYCQASSLLKEMKGNSLVPDITSYSNLLSVYVSNWKLAEALSVFEDMNAAKCKLNLMTCNTMIDVYGQLGMAMEADRLFWSMMKMGMEPNIVSHNIMLRVYVDAELYGEAIHLFQLMQRKGMEQNVVTYNNMIKMYGRICEYEEAEHMMEMMQDEGIEPNSITYSLIVSTWIKARKLDNVAMLFQKLVSSGVEIDELLYQTMIVGYQKAGLVGHAGRLLQELNCADNTPMAIDIQILARAGLIEEVTWAFQWALDAGEVKEISTFRCMLELYSKNRMYMNVIKVFEKMKAQQHVPDSSMFALVLDAYGSLQKFEKADAAYREMRKKGVDLCHEVHFQMLSLYGLNGDFDSVTSLFEDLDSNQNMNKEELRLVVNGIYERAGWPNYADRVRSGISRNAT